MRKNRMMRAASALLVAVLLTTSTISGTFAKYVTQDSAEDVARVAKWGVVVTAGGSLFENTYKDAPVTGDTVTVESNGAVNGVENVVAPGTNNTDDVFKFSIVGKPEVDVKVEVEVVNDKDIFLNGAGLPKMTTGDVDDTFNVVDYYPIDYTLTQTTQPIAGAGTTTTLVDAGRLSEVVTALEAIANAKIDANTDLGATYGEYELSWKWDYEDANTNNDADTLLGDIAAGTALTPAVALDNGTDYNLETGLKFTITVTQID